MQLTEIFILSLVVFLIILIIFLLISFISNKKEEKDNQDFDEVERQHQIDLAIDRAIRYDGFDIVYQPIFGFDEGKIVSAEALLRLNDDDLGVLFPKDFIGRAEKTGKIVEVGEIVYKKVCQFIRSNPNLLDELMHIEINLSIIECMQENLAEKLIDLLDYYNIPRDFINLEIKESAILLDNPVIQNNIESFHELGIGLTLDDYGTGNATLASIMTLPFNGVKVDRTMLWKAMKSNEAMYALCANINTLRDMETRILVEGAETEEMVETLKNLKCDYAQGFYYATPMKENDFLNFMSNK